VGNVGKHTYAGIGPDDAMAITQAAGNGSNGNTYNVSPFPGLGGLLRSAYIGESMYNGLQAKVEKRTSHGLSFLGTYTWAHAGDDASNPGIGGGPPLRNSYLIPLKDEFTNANYDVRQRVSLNGMYDLPFGKGRKYVHDAGPLDYFVGGWSTSLTWAAQTGNPMTVTTGGNFVGANGADNFNALRIGNPFASGGTPPTTNVDTGTCPSQVKTKAAWFNPCAFADPVQGMTPNIGIHDYLTDEADAIKFFGGKSQQIYGPGFDRVNMSMFKNFRIWRETYLQFRADAFNVLNHPSWGNPGDPSDNGVPTLNPGGGQVVAPQNFQNNTPDARFFQLSGKYVF
jgi:hypothetical protein